MVNPMTINLQNVLLMLFSDCVQPRSVEEAVLEEFEVATEI
jgi:hypothetical protein